MTDAGQWAIESGTTDNGVRWEIAPDRPFEREREHREPMPHGSHWWRCVPLTELRLAESRATARVLAIAHDLFGAADYAALEARVAAEP